MKVVCIKNFKSQGLQYELTYGKVYDVLSSKLAFSTLEDLTKYKILNDRSHKEYYEKSHFVTIEQWRKEQIDKIIE